MLVKVGKKTEAAVTKSSLVIDSCIMPLCSMLESQYV